MGTNQIEERSRIELYGEAMLVSPADFTEVQIKGRRKGNRVVEAGE